MDAMRLGEQHGTSAGTWVTAPDAESARALLAMLADGGPEVEAYIPCPSPLSGEWADDLTPRELLAQCGVPDADGETEAEICEVYEGAFVHALYFQAETELRRIAGD